MSARRYVRPDGYRVELIDDARDRHAMLVYPPGRWAVAAGSHVFGVSQPTDAEIEKKATEIIKQYKKERGLS